MSPEELNNFRNKLLETTTFPTVYMFKFIVKTFPLSVPTAAIKWWFFWGLCIGVEVVEGVVK